MHLSLLLVKNHNEFCHISADGEYWLADTGRKVLMEKLNAMLDEVIVHNRKRMSRRGIIGAEAYTLARKLKKLEE